MAARSVLCVLLVALLSLASAFTIGETLTGRQKRQLRSAAGRLAAEKQLRSVVVAEPARSAAEVSEQLDVGELVRARFPNAQKKKEVRARYVDGPQHETPILPCACARYRQPLLQTSSWASWATQLWRRCWGIPRCSIVRRAVG